MIEAADWDAALALMTAFVAGFTGPRAFGAAVRMLGFRWG